MYSVRYQILLIFGIALHESPVSGKHDDPKSIPISEPLYGCRPHNNEDSQPYWSDDTIPALKLNKTSYNDLKTRLSMLYEDFLTTSVVNNVDNFLRLYDDYEKSGLKDSEKYFSTYRIGNRTGSNFHNQNRAILNIIARDDAILKIAPNITHSMFFAATMLKRKIEVIAKNNNGCFELDNFKLTTAVIKISYFDMDTEETNKGHIIINPELSWRNPITVMSAEFGEEVGYPHTGLTVYYAMITDGKIYIARKRDCPIRISSIYEDEIKLLGWRAAQRPLVFNVIKLNDREYIIGERDPLIVNSDKTGIKSPIIYIGKPYCSFDENVEKYELLSPYKTIAKRDKPGRGKFGVFVTITDGRDEKKITNFDLFAISPVDSALKTTEIAFDSLQDTPISESFSSELGMESQDLIKKLQQLKKIMYDKHFMKLIRNNNEFELVDMTPKKRKFEGICNTKIAPTTRGRGAAVDWVETFNKK